MGCYKRWNGVLNNFETNGASYNNTLKQVRVISRWSEQYLGDMNNCHMLSIIEQKMCADDRKVWSRDLERGGKRDTLQGLME